LDLAGAGSAVCLEMLNRRPTQTSINNKFDPP
jgi:hypothetical protein